MFVNTNRIKIADNLKVEVTHTIPLHLDGVEIPIPTTHDITNIPDPLKLKVISVLVNDKPVLKATRPWWKF